VRWQHPDIGLISPANFIPLAEETGLIIPIGEWVLRTACTCLKGWIDAGLQKIRMAVNLSSRQFNHKDLAGVITGILSETGLEPQQLELELTERIVMEDAEKSIRLLDELKTLGVQFSIDDFGTGYSSLSYLKHFPIDRIKIDQSFVHNLTTDPENAAISQAIIAMTHGLNMKTIAEGVETPEQQEFLRSHQCDEIQGFHFSRPLPEAEMEQLLRQNAATEDLLQTPGPDSKVLLLVDDEEEIINALARSLKVDGYHILRTTSPRDAMDMLTTNQVGVIIADQYMQKMNGSELLRRVRKLYPDTVRILISAHSDPAMIVKAINDSAVYKFISKPWSDEQLRTDVRESFLHHLEITSRRE